MTAFALHLPEHRGVGRWLFAACVILALYAAVVAAVLFWPARTPPAPELVPAIAVSLAPVQSAAPEVHEQPDLPVGPEMQQAEAAPPEPPKIEQQKVEEVQPPPPAPVQDAEVALPKAEPKPVEKKEEVQPPAPETRAPPKNEHVGEFTQAASNAYNALVVGHLARFKRYPAAAHGASGKVTVRFVLSRGGEVVDCAVVASSGNAAVDQEVVDILRRASPFPAFPAAKPGDRDSYTIPIAFAPH
jgi:periplasmic protein TonB